MADFIFSCSTGCFIGLVFLIVLSFFYICFGILFCMCWVFVQFPLCMFNWRTDMEFYIRFDRCTDVMLICCSLDALCDIPVIQKTDFGFCLVFVSFLLPGCVLFVWPVVIPSLVPILDFGRFLCWAIFFPFYDDDDEFNCPPYLGASYQRVWIRFSFLYFRFNVFLFISLNQFGLFFEVIFFHKIVQKCL